MAAEMKTSANMKSILNVQFPLASREMEEALKKGTTKTLTTTVSVTTNPMLTFEEAIQKAINEIIYNQCLNMRPHLTSDDKFCIEETITCEDDPMRGIKLPRFSCVEGIPSADDIIKNKNDNIALVSKINGKLTSTFDVGIVYQYRVIDARIAFALASACMEKAVELAKSEQEEYNK